ncbi:RES family NAD+ phosphorylase [Psychromonas sp. Urea-02u-13]|uniref:RES family NAD+ phosphorylase n=1 Tax=Psychromonas sp. Urea-02u-13 TaxID=2058326 RepID=UPI0012FE9CF8|nr:RES family NAD+ phosphorylase [Psychromonas sp. Urea-02u-13]
MSFNSWQSYWKFSRKITSDTRYIYDDETSNFINEVLRTSDSRKKTLKTGHKLWRSQIGSEIRTICNDDGIEIGEETVPYPKNRMYPLECSANEGRVNPKGIPYIYLATDWETSMSECRPWIGMNLSVGQFIVTKNLNVVDCSENHSTNPLYFDLKKGIYEPNSEEREKAVWAHIDKAFSMPINTNETQAHYVPTQVIAEAFKTHGYDGIIYKSMLGKGFNIALFNMKSVDMEKRSVFEVKTLDITYSQTS